MGKMAKRKAQRPTKQRPHSIPKTRFRAVVRQIIQDICGKPYPVECAALELLQLEGEAYMERLFVAALAVCGCAGMSELQAKHLQCVSALIGCQ